MCAHKRTQPHPYLSIAKQLSRQLRFVHLVINGRYMYIAVSGDKLREKSRKGRSAFMYHKLITSKKK